MPRALAVSVAQLPEESDSERSSQVMLDRLTAMGINARIMSGGRSVLADMRLQSTHFEGLEDTLQLENVVFTTVGRDRIKCLRPRALFQLPMISIADCRDITSIEARIHMMWKKHVIELGVARTWLRQIGIEHESTQQGSTLSFPLDPSGAKVQMIDRRHAVLPSRGPLAGVALQRPEDRAPRIDLGIASAVDLQLTLTTRMEELGRLAERLEDERRQLSDDDRTRLRMADAPRRRTPVLMVGPRLASERNCIESLRLRGYEVHIANAERDGIALYDRVSPELVLCDFDLGRSDATDFLFSLRRVFGVEEIPVMLVDTVRNDARRDLAKRVGAAGYLVHPVDVRRIEEHVDHLIVEPRRRRFTRYDSRLPTNLSDGSMTGMAVAVGRGGLFLATEQPLDPDEMQICRMTLPELGQTVAFEAEIIYARPAEGRFTQGVGCRFHSFEAGHEPLLLDYLKHFDVAAPH